MSSCNIIVDSCSYFRLAQNIRPLLKNPFGGREKHCLGVIEELDKEYEKTQPSKINFYGLARMNIVITEKTVFLRTETSVQKSNTPFSSSGSLPEKASSPYPKWILSGLPMLMS